MRALGWILVAVTAALLLFAWGPRPHLLSPERRAIDRAVPTEPAALDTWIAAREDRFPDLREGTRAHIRWADGVPERRELALVVLHGFSASPGELRPLPDRVADGLGAHVVYARLAGHGLSGADLARPGAGAWLADAERAYRIGTRIADRVVLMGSSTGATLGLWLQVHHAHDPSLLGAVHLSPNLGLASAPAEALAWPWVPPLLTTVVPEHCFEVLGPDHARLWTPCYDTRAVVSLVALLEHVRGLPLEEARQPTLLIWNPDDNVIRTDLAAAAAARMPAARIHPHAPPPDRSQHVLAGDVLNPGGTEALAPVILEAIRGWRATEASGPAP